MDWGKTFQVSNNSERVLITGVLTLRHGTTTVVEPHRYSQSVIEDLKKFVDRGFLEATNDVNQKEAPKKNAFSVKELGSTGGNKSAIVVEPIDLSGKAISVQENTDTGPAIKLGNDEKKETSKDKMTKEEAVEFLSQHWKKVEAEVKKIDDARKLNYLLVVAIEVGVAEKKKEIIEERLNEI